jgi:hypothetical protein
MAIMIIGTITSPLLAGRCYDLYGDYRLAWFVMAAVNFAVMPLVIKIRPPHKSIGRKK